MNWCTVLALSSIRSVNCLYSLLYSAVRLCVTASVCTPAEQCVSLRHYASGLQLLWLSVMTCQRNGDGLLWQFVVLMAVRKDRRQRKVCCSAAVMRLQTCGRLILQGNKSTATSALPLFDNCTTHVQTGVPLHSLQGGKPRTQEAKLAHAAVKASNRAMPTRFTHQPAHAVLLAAEAAQRCDRD
jgi:hypothetical protein